jgi:hypothetical protein
MTDAQLIEFATEFRAGMLGDDPSTSACLMVCAPLVTLLNIYGVKCELIETNMIPIKRGGRCSTNHVWLRLADGRALDPTADQFNELDGARMPPVYLGKPTKYHRGARNGRS